MTFPPSSGANATRVSRRTRAAAHRPANLRCGGLLGAALLVCLGCTSISGPNGPVRERAPRADSALLHVPLDPADVKVQPQGRSVEQSWILDLYTLLHARDYTSFRILFPGNDDQQSTAHLLIPAGAGPHPVAVIFPILEGSHVVSEGLAKALVNRGYAAARMERESLDLAEVSGAEAPARAMRNAILA